MDDKVFLALLRLYLSRNIKISYKIAKTRLECHRLIHSYRRHLILRVLLILDNSLYVNCRYVWSLKKNGKR
jgi:hypothetical protein